MTSEASRPSLHSRLRPTLLSGLCALALLPAARAASDYATPYTFSPFVGTGSPGSANGTGAAASFSAPTGVALSSSGTLYVADRTNNVIREVTSAGAVTTLAGEAGTTGSTDATGTAALFNQPAAVAVGAGGDIYVCDTGNNTIRKITPQGVVTTVAGTSGEAGSINGTGTAALFNRPSGIAVDGSGNLYVADTGNNCIRKISASGAVKTLAGTAGVATTANSEVGSVSPAGSADGTGSAATFYQPAALAIDSSGNLWVADTDNNTIREVTSAGVVTTLAGTPLVEGTDDGTGSAARFNNPLGIAVDSSGNLYVADTGDSLVRKVTSAGVVTTLAGTPDSFAVFYGSGQSAVFDVPTGIAVDSSGDLYVSERLGDVIAKGVAPSGGGTTTSTVAPVFTVQPLSIAVSGGEVALTAAATGASSYQWMLNGTSPVLGGTGSTLVLGSAAPGSYTCVATNSAGSATSNAATITVEATVNPGRLVNLSCRAGVGTGGNILIAGFAVGGAGTTGTDTLLVRASGPALVAYGVTGTLADPELSFYSGSTEISSNDGWGGSAAISNAAAAVGAFAWTSASSHDSALLVSPEVGAYTAQVAGDSGDTGVALAEVYDTSGAYVASTPRLTNLSARVQVGTGGSILIAGFDIGGSTAVTVLVRASGPALVPLGVSGTLADPEVQVLSGTTVVASDTGWGASSAITAAAAYVGAFSWGTAATADSAVLVTLPPGAYTAEVSGASGDTGVALVEVYQVP